MRRAVAACTLALLLIGPVPVLARDTLPWKDANPVGRTGERAKAKPAKRRTALPKAAVVAAPVAAAAAAATLDVPVPQARPGTADEPVSADPVVPPSASEAAPPQARPADAPPPEPTKPEPAKSEPVKPEPAKSESEPTDAPAPAAADRPVSDIPVPDKRPAPTPAEVAPTPASSPAPAPAAETPPPAATVPVPEPVPPTQKSPEPAVPQPAPEPEAAPNSTEKLKSREPDVTPAATVEAAAAVEDSIACEATLTSRGVEFTVEETISEGECGVLRPVALKRLSSGVEVSPKTQMLCRTALALDDWMTGSVVPAAKANLPGESLTEFRHASTYVCRPRASESGISEHARGSAIDIGSFVFKSGRDIGIAAKAPNTPDERFLDAVRAGACGPFKTVLGPGTDADHATHFHLDIAARKNGSTYCK